jgi:hypothetical protein
MAQAGNLAAFDLDEKTIILYSLYVALDFLAFLEIRQCRSSRPGQISRTEGKLDLFTDGIDTES